MPVDRRKILTQLSYFKDPAVMRKKYGIAITQEQIRSAERAYATYKALPDADLKKMDESRAMRWPYTLTEAQRYDRIMFEAGAKLTVTQTVLWGQIKSVLERNPETRRTDGMAITAALAELEQFMQLNAYLGNFEENQAIVQGEKTQEIMGIFNAAYGKNAKNSRN